MGNEEQIERFMRIKRVNGQSEETITNQERILRQLSQYFNKPFKEANEEDLLRFLTMKKYSLSTMKIHMAIIKSFYRFLYGMKRRQYATQVENLKGVFSNKCAS